MIPSADARLGDDPTDDIAYVRAAPEGIRPPPTTGTPRG